MKVAFFFAGKRIPSYQVNNLFDFKKRFSNIELYFVTDNIRAAEYIGTFGIKTFLYDTRKSSLSELTRYEKSNKLLFNSLIRFYGIQALLNYTQESVILVESDVWLARNFPFSKFEKLQSEMAYPLLFNGSAIASTVFFRDSSSVNNFINYIERALNVQPCLTDMQIMWNYQIEHDDRVIVLPTSTKHQGAFNFPSEVLINSKISSNIELFDGLFDGATWGQFITGEDPRNLLGIQRIYHKIGHHSVNPGNYLIDSKSTGEINVKIADLTLPLYSLHIHSKDKKYFSEYQTAILNKRITGISVFEKYEFHLLKGLQGIRKESLLNFMKFVKELISRPFN
jgi:hypothetical protein